LAGDRINILGSRGAKAAANGSGPAKGFLEVSDAYSSSKAVQGLSNSKPIDFIYDPASQRFIMGRNQFGHDGILDAGKIPSSDAIVLGGIWKENGVLRAYEWSGHYGMRKMGSDHYSSGGALNVV
jgi:filamentous hemagglutinin